MPTTTWKCRERQVAKYFGGERTPLSGNNSKHTGADIIHDRLFVEHKHRKRHTLLTLFDKVKKLARRETKIPVVTISEHGRKGFWLLVHSDDLTEVANQRSRARQIETGGGIAGKIPEGLRTMVGV
jgi:hypothetical protein